MTTPANTTWKRRITLWPVTCGVTGARIPMFKLAYKRWTEYDQLGFITEEFDWVSDKGKILSILQGT